MTIKKLLIIKIASVLALSLFTFSFAFAKDNDVRSMYKGGKDKGGYIMAMAYLNRDTNELKKGNNYSFYIIRSNSKNLFSLMLLKGEDYVLSATFKLNKKRQFLRMLSKLPRMTAKNNDRKEAGRLISKDLKSALMVIKMGLDDDDTNEIFIYDTQSGEKHEGSVFLTNSQIKDFILICQLVLR